MIVYENPDKSIAMTFPARQFVETYGEHAVATRNTPEGFPFWLVDGSAIPRDMTFSAAWEVPDSWGGPDGHGSPSSRFEDIADGEARPESIRRDTVVNTNRDRAEAVAQDLVRVWRQAEFARNDIDLQNALVDGTDTTALVERREWLRDLPQMCEGRTVEELRALLVELGIVGGGDE